MNKLGHNKVGEHWKMMSLEGTITNKTVLKFQKQMCEHLILCYLPVSK